MIKFRAKAAMTCHRIGRDKPLYEKGDCVYGWLFKSVHSYEQHEMDSYVIQTVIDGEVMSVDVVEETVGQFTGLLDKNGKEIYEGDIVKVNDDYSNYGFMAGEIRMVWFNMGGYRLKPKYESSITRGDKGYWLECGDDFEVIGNIHDNPELLNNND